MEKNKSRQYYHLELKNNGGYIDIDSDIFKSYLERHQDRVGGTTQARLIQLNQCLKEIGVNLTAKDWTLEDY